MYFLNFSVVWKSTTNVGIARALRNGKIVIVANYSPPGEKIINHFFFATHESAK
jgi:hypothetical protein